MTVIDTALPDVKLIDLRVFRDERGVFLESFQARQYEALLGLRASFVQDNYSRSKRHVLRGLHFQCKHPQGKLVRVVQGEVYDVVVDVRLASPMFGRWQGLALSHAKPQQLWIPPGYAHGFVVLSDEAGVEYKCTDYYHPEDEACLSWDDRTLAIDWPVRAPVLSPKDRQGLSLKALQETGKLPVVAGAS
ncbi:MAG: dTDP-4-dehydrorhamnose 3,5-epimerase [Burkholderiaceae bacterium]|nr:MAG: dTDP-4-dehydrorhamnose 3,5-epimerase [Burkholderiaceae bacterium]TAM05056.1 MAG: dTDP-4-dehydrorhamnose 3,5-epimerase [Pusillimonas sp.]